jgi:hypothetical protein
VAKHHQGTLGWVLEHGRYKHWIHLDDTDNSRFLWISGNPGCGKTVLSKFLLDSVEDSVKTQGLARKQPVLYFFFDDKYDKQKSAVSLLRTLLHQILEQLPALIDHVMPYYISQGTNMVESLGTLWKIFRAVTTDRKYLDGVYVFVDALDECDETSRENLLSYFEQHFNDISKDSDSTFLKVVATSRPYPRIEHSLPSDFCIRLKTEDAEGRINEDISSFISHTINKIMGAEYDKGLLKDIEDSMKAQADGMFLWASLVIEDLRVTPLKEIRDKLKTIPSGIDALYRNLLDQLGQRPNTAKMASKILMWVVNAPRPMKIQELAWACTTERSHKAASSVDTELIEYFRTDIKHCGPILKIDKAGEVKLVHQSA